jgi:hypothetical protein
MSERMRYCSRHRSMRPKDQHRGCKTCAQLTNTFSFHRRASLGVLFDHEGSHVNYIGMPLGWSTGSEFADWALSPDGIGDKPSPLHQCAVIEWDRGFTAGNLAWQLGGDNRREAARGKGNRIATNAMSDFIDTLDELGILDGSYFGR